MLVDLDGLPVNIGRPAEGVVDHTCADGGIGHAVDEDEISGGAVFTVGIDGYGA